MKAGHYIRTKRLAAGRSLRDVADEIGVSHVFLGSLERGTKRVPDRLVDKLVDAIPNLVAKTLKMHLRAEEPIRIEVPEERAGERALLAAFARKAAHGFSEDEIQKLRALVSGLEDVDEP